MVHLYPRRGSVRRLATRHRQRRQVTNTDVEVDFISAEPGILHYRQGYVYRGSPTDRCGSGA
jgi:hypothetical protein